MVVAGAAMLLPWHLNAGLGGNQTVRGISIGEGRLLIVACAVTIGLIRIAWRPAWIGAGFAGAIAVREVFDPSGIGPPGQPPDPGIGVWIAVLASAAAVVLLLWEMLAGVSGSDGVSNIDEPPRRGFSGPLGRRR